MGNLRRLRSRHDARPAGVRWSVARAALGVPVLLAAWGGFALVTAHDASASPQPGTAESHGTYLTFVAGAGTVNKVTLTRESPSGAVLLSDTGNPIAFAPASDGTCTKLDADTVRCPASLSKVEIHLQDGNDTFHTGLGVYTVIHGSDGDDVLEGGNGGGEIHGGAGKDSIYGGDIRDVVRGGAGDDTIIGGGGNDDLSGQSGRDEIHGGDGEDRIDGGADKDNVYGDNGKDDLRSTDVDDNQYGGPGDDTLGSGIDVLGQDGDDRVVMTESVGEYWGGPGSDVIDYAEWGGVLNVSLDGNSNDGGSGADCDDWIGCPVAPRHNVHGDFEHVIGTPFNDKISGNNEADILDGGAGSDRLYGNGGNDYLDAQGGANQRTEGGAGYDTCVGFGVTARPGCEE